MSPIIKTVRLQWDGNEYVVAVTMGLINRIEEDVNLMRLALRLQSGTPPMSHVAVVFAHLLAAGGCTVQPKGEKHSRAVTSGDIWNGMFQDGEDSAMQIVTAATAALQCVFPDVKIKALEGEEAPKKKHMTKTLPIRGRKSTAAQ